MDVTAAAADSWCSAVHCR